MLAISNSVKIYQNKKKKEIFSKLDFISNDLQKFKEDLDKNWNSYVNHLLMILVKKDDSYSLGEQIFVMNK